MDLYFLGFFFFRFLAAGHLEGMPNFGLGDLIGVFCGKVSGERVFLGGETLHIWGIFLGGQGNFGGFLRFFYFGGVPNLGVPPQPPHEGRAPPQQHLERGPGPENGGAAEDRGQPVPGQGLGEKGIWGGSQRDFGEKWKSGRDRRRI